MRETTLRRATPRRHPRWVVFNRTINPVVKLVLRSPLHRLLSSKLALITLKGRRSGRPFTIPVGYREEKGDVHIEVGFAEQKLWWRNLEGDGAPVRLRIRGRDRLGHAVARRDERGGVVVDVHTEPVVPDQPAR